jgi:hypothetical protein
MQTLKDLKNAFAAAVDEADLRSQFKEKVCRNNGVGLTLLGEGTHFRVFKARGLGGADLVIKRALPHFGGGPDSPGRQAWLRALATLKPQVGQLPLIAPWLLLEDGPELGLVMPYFPDPVPKGEDYRATLAPRLAALGLELPDKLQLRTWSRGGAPYVIDLSDLRRTASGSR